VTRERLELLSLSVFLAQQTLPGVLCVVKEEGKI
jgi:hypothetical protein